MLDCCVLGPWVFDICTSRVGSKMEKKQNPCELLKSRGVANLRCIICFHDDSREHKVDQYREGQCLVVQYSTWKNWVWQHETPNHRLPHDLFPILLLLRSYLKSGQLEVQQAFRYTEAIHTSQFAMHRENFRSFLHLQEFGLSASAHKCHVTMFSCSIPSGESTWVPKGQLYYSRSTSGNGMRVRDQEAFMSGPMDFLG